MDTTTHAFPRDAVVAEIFVDLYSFICLTFGVLLVTVLFKTKERFSYVLLLAVSTTASTIVNIIQQIYSVATWRQLRVEVWEKSVAAHLNPTEALGPLSSGFNEVLWYIATYLYNVDAMLMLFWAIALTFSVWNWQLGKLESSKASIGVVSKIAAFILPAIFIGVSREYRSSDISIGVALVLLNLLMSLSFVLGTVCIVLILIKYLTSRFGLYSNPIGSLPSHGNSTHTSRSRTIPRLTMRVDPWLVVRFTIAFFILSGFEIFLILYGISRYNHIRTTEQESAPNFSTHETIIDILNYLPGVSASLLAFLLFGTTTQLRKTYNSIFARLNPMKTKSRPTSARVVGGSTTDWSRMTDDSEDPGNDPRRYTLRMGRLESIELGRVPKMPSSEKDGGFKTSVFDYGARPIGLGIQGADAERGVYNATRKLGVLEDCDSEESYAPKKE